MGERGAWEGVGMLVPGCVSCDIVAGKRVEPGGAIFENDYWHVGIIGSLPVVWRRFLSIKLKRHCEQLGELSPAEALALGPVIRSTCLALAEVLKPAKFYVCSFGEGVRHILWWVLPRPPGMRPGMHPVIFNLDMRRTLTRFFGIRNGL
jgi:diadenosine tetraphosphate (Ap4A) HIT family hydrolase